MRGAAVFADLLVFACLASVFVAAVSQGLDCQRQASARESGLIRDALLLWSAADAGRVQLQRGDLLGATELNGGRTLAELCEDMWFAQQRGSPEELGGIVEERIRSWMNRVFGGRFGYLFEVSIPGENCRFSVDERTGFSHLLATRELSVPSLRFPSERIVLRVEVWS